MHKILLVARLELTKSKSIMDRRVFVFMVMVTLIMALAAPTMDVSTFSMTKGLYLVNVDGPPLDVVLASDNRFRLVDSE